MRSENLQRGWLLYEQNRPEMALDFARRALADDVNDADAHRLLALVHIDLQRYQREKKLDDARRSAETAVELEPGDTSNQFVLALVLTEQEEWAKAGKLIAEIIAREPAVPGYWNLSAVVHMHFNRWEKALEEIDRGLRLDPENTTLQTNRARCLISLGRRGEVVDTLEAALHRDPDNADTHVSQGYAYLHQGKYKEAMQHYGEALRLDPMNGAARAGMLESMRARNPVYALLLSFFLWMTRFSRQAQLAIVFGGMIGVRMVYNSLKDTQPTLALLIVLTYVGFVLLTWVAQPLANLILRLDKYARHMLDEEEILASNFIGGLALLFLGSLAAAALMRDLTWLHIAGGALCLMLPVPLMISARKTWVRWVCRVFWGGLVLLVLLAIPALLLGLKGAAAGLSSLVLLATVAYSWLASILRGVR